ncbi:hypothetical protein L596_002730 [Steinernema carpocapsae]|uniref:Uncharacterized protein n=1 Tax=Steinernema carpocapsae TaxID=34508 RepID=A0A4U8URY6_STECR|nr:hypothetical protein L596_002730 [Steinernema carpocapsae]
MKSVSARGVRPFVGRLGRFAGSSRGLLGVHLRGCQPLHDPRETCDTYAERHPAGTAAFKALKPGFTEAAPNRYNVLSCHCVSFR